MFEIYKYYIVAVCSTHCQNGGSCVRPDVCSCPTGFKGKYCEIDIDECKEQKPCEQICHNTAGSYKCDCREMFALQPDGHSCKLEGKLNFNNINTKNGL